MRAEVELLANRPSPLHDWDARWKVASLTVLVAVLASLESLGAALWGAAGALGLLLGGRLPFRLLAARLGAAQAFLLPCLVWLPLAYPGDPVLIGGVRISGEGARIAALLYLRALAILAVVMAVVCSTPMMVLLRGLQGLRVPRGIVEVALLTYRYLFTLSWEFTRMRWALASRGFGNRPARTAYRPLANVVGVALVRSLERTERIQQAMECRGFAGHLRTLHRLRGGPACWLKSAACTGFAVGLLVLDRTG